MQILLDKILDVHTIQALNNVLSDESLFEDGKKTAGKTAKRVKNNLQAKPDAEEIKGAVKLLEKTLLAHPAFNAAALPHSFAKIMFSRYTPGMAYGPHIDDPFIAGRRVDLSFTLFLSEPDSYEGGELVLQKHDGDEGIKLSPGALVLYPSTSLHYVEKLSSGTRLAAVGWIQSRVRLAEHREILFDLQQSLELMPDQPENQEARLNLLKAKSNIMRLWADH